MDLMLALFDSSCDRPRYIEFKIEDNKGEYNRLYKSLVGPGKVTVVVQSLEREDGSGESWNLKGRFDTGQSGFMYSTGEWSAYYDTRTRKGCFTTEVNHY